MRRHVKRHLAHVSRWDRRFVASVGRVRHGPWDAGFKHLSDAATHGKLWFGVAAAMAVVPGRPRRAAVHGLLALGVASAVTNLVFKTALPRRRPLPEHLPHFRFVHPQPTSSSLPSGHSASAVAFATGVAMVSPTLGAVTAPLAAGVAYSRVHTGAHWPSDVILGSALGLGAAAVTRNWWPAKEAAPRPDPTPADAPALGEGEGVVIALNTLGGSYQKDTGQALQAAFPRARMIEIGKGDDLCEELERAADEGAVALGIWGGDGSVGAAASVAAERQLPLLVFPGGTLNHFARDALVRDVKSVAEAARSGHAIASDVGIVSVHRGADGNGDSQQLFMLNTASVGIYPNLVRRRELLEKELGRPLAGVLAGLRTFALARPTPVLIDGERKNIWILYVGRGRYYPEDLAPLVRPKLDDGLLDLRILEAEEKYARAKLLWAVVTGTTPKSSVTHLRTATRVMVEALDGPLSLAVDGEVVSGVRRVEFSVDPRALTVYSSGHV